MSFKLDSALDSDGFGFAYNLGGQADSDGLGNIIMTMFGELRCNDDITAFANLTFSSDSRLKHEIEAINSGEALTKINDLQGVYFRYNDKPKDKNIGLIAQEVLEVVPEIVREKSGYYTVNYANLTGMLVEAVKELTKRVEELEQNGN
jgi:hypothetical protein